MASFSVPSGRRSDEEDVWRTVLGAAGAPQGDLREARDVRSRSRPRCAGTAPARPFVPSMIATASSGACDSSAGRR
jgi:hypothetical protein